MDRVCGNCLHMKSYLVCDFGFCTLGCEVRVFTSSCGEFKDSYSLRELRCIEDERRFD